MVDHKYLSLFLGGVAVGGVGTALIWKYCYGCDESPILRSIRNVDCWPLDNVKWQTCPRMHVISDAVDFKNVTNMILNQVNQVRQTIAMMLDM